MKRTPNTRKVKKKVLKQLPLTKENEKGTFQARKTDLDLR